jgi:hypothetical protein
LALLGLQTRSRDSTTGGEESDSGAERDKDAFHELPRLGGRIVADRGMQHIRCSQGDIRCIGERALAQCAMIRLRRREESIRPAHQAKLAPFLSPGQQYVLTIDIGDR